MLFLDFEKAFGRLDRAWIERCKSEVDFGPGCSGGCASCTRAHPGCLNGWHADFFQWSQECSQAALCHRCSMC